MNDMERTMTLHDHAAAESRGFGTASREPTMPIYANVVRFHWLIASGFYLVLAPADPSPKRSNLRPRYIGPVSSQTAAKMLKTSALFFGLADRAFQHD